ncbi:MarR family winged helix-turn-helix transcriptional regulator [Streptomyces sp. FH025]|uniref:MarR family winged helix-turn-helix transcriptional regulator n=1 Tax=Streptomyces sp. FH025 TaxID=2815937 RepID=UPI001A9D5163|nr:MarR family transcriptional regulator [Streptomyces sp. FH025]MBO1419207.1 MarR family transcriptional regulator [Streptomyces sp. FH025]
MEQNAASASESAVRAAGELRVLLNRLRRRLKETEDPHGLTPSQASVLSRLADGPATVGDLAAAERVRSQSMTNTIAALAERGLIERQPDPSDGRRQVISLSRQAVEQLNDSRHAREEWLAGALQERYTAAERRSIIEALALLGRLVE